jgi:thiol-disulfide isomerase/thioredoxin
MPRPCRAAIVPALCLALGLALTGCKNELEPPPGDVASGLALQTLDGTPFDPATLRGKPVIVMFWRTGCPYCMNEMPVVAKVARDKGAAAIAVMVSGNKEKAKQIAKTFDGTILVDDGSLKARYEIKAVPYTLILRGDGTASHAFKGEQGESTLASALD